jgi:hypothetical protein
MRRSSLLFFLGFATIAFAQEPAKPQARTQEEAPDKAAQERVRVERAAGGVGRITPEEREGANLGAGPHKERHTDAARREPREAPADPSSERESARGNTR